MSAVAQRQSSLALPTVAPYRSTAWTAFGALTQETSVAVTGVVREDARAPGGFELTASDLTILGPSHEFPI